VQEGHVSLADAYNMPVFMRKWWIEKTIERIKRKNEENNKNN